MRQLTRWTRGRPDARRSSPAAALCAACLGAALLGGCAGGGDGTLAAGAAGPADGRAPTGPVPPGGGIDFVPLDGDRAPSEGPSPSRTPRPSAGGTDPRTDAGAGTDADARGGPESPAGTGSGAPTPRPSGAGDQPPGGDAPGGDHPTRPGPTPPGTPPSDPEHPTTPPSSPPSTPGGPAYLTLGEPERTAADERWCEKVAVTVHNTGGKPVKAGTITFATHIIGWLGTDWGTVETTQELPVPIAAGEKKEKTWTVCVDAWRVPLGMHVETRDVSARWD
ncbi:hypothetical protein [Streptomyces sp. XD-27]|uniref:hypothetical protein n=1 Tax=Streptomyces sp. XD-27 TaxID=3062779 RepID=UPI0026F44955|nr:hypothetical protein [Streptomyces sp. XD-27]WKX71675.1 hypothetical protein Q3Y56_18740 [Streptomyces sp. XD-27]